MGRHVVDPDKRHLVTVEAHALDAIERLILAQMPGEIPVVEDMAVAVMDEE